LIDPRMTKNILSKTRMNLANTIAFVFKMYHMQYITKKSNNANSIIFVCEKS